MLQRQLESLSLRSDNDCMSLLLCWTKVNPPHRTQIEQGLCADDCLSFNSCQVPDNKWFAIKVYDFVGITYCWNLRAKTLLWARGSCGMFSIGSIIPRSSLCLCLLPHCHSFITTLSGGYDFYGGYCIFFSHALNYFVIHAQWMRGYNSCWQVFLLTIPWLCNLKIWFPPWDSLYVSVQHVQKIYIPHGKIFDLNTHVAFLLYGFCLRNWKQFLAFTLLSLNCITYNFVLFALAIVKVMAWMRQINHQTLTCLWDPKISIQNCKCSCDINFAILSDDDGKIDIQEINIFIIF